MLQQLATFSWLAESLLLLSPSIPSYDEKSFLEKRHERLPLLCSVVLDLILCLLVIYYLLLL